MQFLSEVTWVYLIAFATLVQSDYENDCRSVGPLGVISGEVADHQMSASSTEPASWRKNCRPSQARLYRSNRHSWCAKFKSFSEWLQVDLGVEAVVTGVMTQGRGDGNEWISSFIISYSSDGSNFHYIKDNYDTQKTFEGNTDSFTVKHNYFDKPIRARFVKFHTYTWHKHPSMRVELLGCQPCKQLLGQFPYGRLMSSGSRGKRKRRSCIEEYGHILSNKGWCARNQNTYQWLQLDIGPPSLVTALVTRGRGDGKQKHWVTHYQVSYSNNSRNWYYYKETSDHGPRSSASLSVWGYRNLIRNGTIFEGNRDKNTKKIRYLREPFVARFIRFHPVNWVGRISMRIGVYGCKQKGECGEGFFRINDHSPCVANLAYKKTAWISSDTNDANGGGPMSSSSRGGKMFKRHLQPEEYHNQYEISRQAGRAVDGLIKWQLNTEHQQDGGSSNGMIDARVIRKRHRETCTELNYHWPYSKHPTWFVNLGEQVPVNGLVIYNGYDLIFGEDAEDLSERQRVERVERISVLVDRYNNFNMPGGVAQPQADNFCGSVTNFNKALLKPRLHISCRRPIIGQFVYIHASMNDDKQRRQNYKTVLCEVMVY